jgi:imidazolonepropionase-like amidohydrolase
VAPTLLINEVIASGGVPVDATAQHKAAELVEQRNALLADAAGRGVRFVLGTDANGHHVAFGDQFRELARMAEVLGMSQNDALRAATSWAAESIGREHDLGRLQVGFVADAVLVRGRPWQQLSDLSPENVVAVILGGRIVHGRLPAEVTS